MGYELRTSTIGGIITQGKTVKLEGVAGTTVQVGGVSAERYDLNHNELNFPDKEKSKREMVKQ